MSSYAKTSVVFVVVVVVVVVFVVVVFAAISCGVMGP